MTEESKLDVAPARETSDSEVAGETAVVRTTSAGTIESWNEAAERMFGYSAADMLGCFFGVIVAARDGADVKAFLRRCRESGKAGWFLTRRQPKVGGTVEVMAKYVEQRNPDGRIAGLTILHRRPAAQQHPA